MRETLIVKSTSIDRKVANLLKKLGAFPRVKYASSVIPVISIY